MPSGSAPGERRGGRQAGTPNKEPSAFRTQLQAYCDSIGADPHKTMADMIVDPEADKPLKFNAAKELAQYLQAKLKSVEHSGSLDHHVEVIQVTLE